MESIFGVQTFSGKTSLLKNNKDEDSVSFKEFLMASLHQVSDLQKDAEKKMSEVVLGDARSVHEVIIATEKAALALQLLVQVQNKAIDAYHEIMRLQF
ncbi:MAG: flagellar hook-basal body complex protein FliE [Thermacetogeniaceae bacterium]|jgi:flagellar hook-basal body complex protein FliE|nr:flagellar hook-basal body complex protein FliE [Thermoanaerobacterales bacterium]NLN21259.1 flagellar hook-basal body complex protein FliE [Syntrophomonadaceae bacterium]HAF16908.1 flagellar hook-basal body complex protein FliE [Peptococcaceae bacterium]